MSISKARKEEIVQDLREKFSASNAVLLADHTGLKVKEITDLRKRLREASVEYLVVKNRLARIALKDSGKEQLEEFFDGPNSIVFLDEDVVNGTKVLIDFIKEHEKPELKIGLVDDRMYDRKELANIAKLPSREVLLANVASGLISPLNRFAFLLTEMLRSFIRAVDAVRAEKETSGEEPN